MIPGDPRLQVLFMAPVFQAVYPRAFENFLAMAFHAGATLREEYAIVPYVEGRTLLHTAMNRAATAAIEHNFDLFMFADDDCLPPFDAIPRLLAHHRAGLPFVAGLGYMRTFPHTTTIGRYDPAGPTLHVDPYGATKLAGFRWIENVDDEGSDLVPADFCGFPIASITVDTLKRLERPWFATSTPLGECTHDVFFGERMRAAGIPIVVDRTIQCGHLSDGYVITDDSRRLVRTAVQDARSRETPA